MGRGRLGTNGTTPAGGEHPATRRGSPVSGPELSAAGRADESTRTTRRSGRSGPPEDRARGVIIRWKRSTHSSDDGRLAPT